MAKSVDEGTIVSLEWWDGITGTWAVAGEYDSADEARAERERFDEANAASYAWAGEPTTWRLVTTTIEALPLASLTPRPRPTMLDEEGGRS